MNRRGRRRWLDVFQQLLLAILFAVLGAVIAPFVTVSERDPKTNALIAAVLCLVAGVLYYLLAHARAHRSELSTLSTALANVQKQLGEEADLLIEPHTSTRGQYFREVTRLIEKLRPGDIVQIMTYHAHPVEEWITPTDPAYVDARDEYFRVLLSKARQGVVYRRVLCFNDLEHNQPLPTGLIRPHMLAHYRDMLDVAEMQPTTALRKACAALMADVVIINGRAIALTVESRGPGKHVYTAGALIAHDPPNSRVVGRLRELWARVESASDSVTADELLRNSPRSAGRGSTA